MEKKRVVIEIEVDDAKAIADNMDTLDYVEKVMSELASSGITLKNARILDSDEDDACSIFDRAENIDDNRIAELFNKFYQSKGICCKCGCELEDNIGFGLGNIFIMDIDGNYYCTNCDGDFEDGSERIFYEDSPITTVRISDIEWDTDGDDIALPEEIYHNFVGFREINDDLMDKIADWLSDTYGYCHKGFYVEAVE